MAARKPKATAVIDVPAIEVSTDIAVETPNVIEFDMGEFAIIPFADRQYTSLYFGLRSLYGQAIRLRDKEIDWLAFNPIFERCFGSIEEKRFSMEELEEFAWKFFHKTVEEVVEHNKKSLARRNEQVDGEVEKADIEMPKLKPVLNMDDIPY